MRDIDPPTTLAARTTAAGLRFLLLRASAARVATRTQAKKAAASADEASHATRLVPVSSIAIGALDQGTDERGG